MFAEMLAWLPGVNELRLLIKIDMTRMQTSYECPHDTEALSKLGPENRDTILAHGYSSFVVPYCTVLQ